MIQQWTAEADKALGDRQTSEEALDIFDVQLEKGLNRQYFFDLQSVEHGSSAPGKAKIKLELAEHEMKSGTFRGVTTWLASGIKIQEYQ